MIVKMCGSLFVKFGMRCLLYLDGHTQLRQTEPPRLQTPQNLQEELTSNPERLLLCKTPQLLQHLAQCSVPAHLEENDRINQRSVRSTDNIIT